MMASAAATLLLLLLSTAAAFLSPNSSQTATNKSCSHASQTCLSSTKSSTSSEAPAAVHHHIFEGYNKPIVLIGSSSSTNNNELHRLASSLSSSLLSHNDKIVNGIKEKVERSTGALLLAEEDEATRGVVLSPLVHDDDDDDEDEGSFVVSYSIIEDLVREKTLSLNSGVLVLDFHPLLSRSSQEGGKNDQETELLQQMTELAKDLYKHGYLSVYINIQSDEDDEAPSLKRKKELETNVFIPYSDYEMCIKNEGSSSSNSPAWTNSEWELQRLIARALLPSPVVGGTGSNSADLLMGQNTFFLSLSFPKIKMAEPYVEEMCADVDSMEYRVDLLECSKEYLAQQQQTSSGEASNSIKETDPRFEILYQQQQLRYMCRPHAERAPALPFGGASVIDDAFPIVYTVRTAHQAGTWPDDAEGIQHMFDLLELGLRSGVEVLDVESAWDASLTDKLLSLAEKRYTSLILGSHHVVGSEVTPDEAVELFRQCRINNRAHGGKVVLSINDDTDNKDQMAYEASIKASKLDTPEIPNIGLVLGKVGSYSRILNPRFTPVTHECLPAKAAPGQLSAAEIMAARLIVGQIPTQKYAILGHNIAYSVSPQMQGGAFAAVKLPHLYTRADLETVREFVDGPLWNDENFGGCSVTIPHKQDIIEHVDVLTDAAKEIGSVNTVIVKKDKLGTRVLIGENTDWRGIYNPLKRRLGDVTSKASTGKTKPVALILGGGGTARAAAYAATKLGLDKIYFNRTPSKVEELATEFGGTVAKSLDDDKSDKGSLASVLDENNGRISVVISTLPAAAEFQLPEWLLESDSLPVVFDVNYKPYSTKLLEQAEEKGCDVVRGSEMLWEQGVGQFELWTGRSAPYGVMKKVVLDNCLPPSSS